MNGRRTSITVAARAKINLTLEILGKRSDGYHELRSVVMPVSLCDRLVISTTQAEPALSVLGAPGVDLSQIGDTKHNLVLRAVKLMQHHFGVKSGARIQLHKRIPIGGGLGGGSADAAAVLLGLAELWQLNCPRAELMALGAQLGSDVPALIHGGVVLMEGRGERVKPLPPASLTTSLEPFWLIIANPGIVCSTPKIFKKWRAGLTNGPNFSHNMTLSICNGDVAGVAGALYNDLQGVVFACYPAITMAAEQLRAAGCLGVLLSGSGASVFGLVRDQAHGNEISQNLGSGLWHVLVHTCPVV